MKTWSVLALAIVLSPIIACAQKITAAGASFPDPIYEKWFQEYHQQHPSIEINYQANGSGAGIKQLTEGTIDFGASDMPMKDEQIGAMKIKPLHFPTVLGGVVLSYNVPGLSKELQFPPDVVVDIFMGKVKNWSDPRIAKANPGVKLPNLDLVVIHRSDGSGTNFVFTDYLSKVSPQWKSTIHADTTVKWPTGLGAAQNSGVAGMIKQTEGAIGYVELIYALQQKMAYATIQNSAGGYLKPTLASVTAAAAGAAKSMPADFRVSITDAPGKEAYPISTFTYLLIPSEIKDPAKKAAVVGFLNWMLTNGEKEVQDNPNLGYAPLPKSVIDKEMKQISEIK